MSGKNYSRYAEKLVGMLMISAAEMRSNLDQYKAERRPGVVQLADIREAAAQAIIKEQVEASRLSHQMRQDAPNPFAFALAGRSEEEPQPKPAGEA